MGKRKQGQKGEEKGNVGDWSQRNQEEKMMLETRPVMMRKKIQKLWGGIETKR